MPADDFRRKLKSLQERIAEQRQTVAEATRARQAAKETFAKADLDIAKATGSPEYLAMKDAVDVEGKAKDLLADLEAQERTMLAALNGSDEPPINRPSGAALPSDPIAAVHQALHSDHYQRFIGSGILESTAKFGSFVLGQVADVDGTMRLLSRSPVQAGPVMADATPFPTSQDGLQGAIPADRRGIVQPNLRPLRLLDLFPMGTTQSNVVEYVQVLTVPSQAQETAPGDQKPEATLVTQDAQATAQTIAVWIKLKRQALADVGMLQTMIATLLTRDVRRRLEDQMVAGDGEGANIKGILETSGIGEPEAVEGDNAADAILRALTSVYLSDGEPNFTAVHPLLWQELLLMRENQAERTGAYLYGSPAALPAPTIWGTNIVNTRAVGAEQPLVGDSMAATPLVREGLTVRVSDSDADDFTHNRVTVLVETRVAVPIWRPSSFGVGTVDIVGVGSGS